MTDKDIKRMRRAKLMEMINDLQCNEAKLNGDIERLKKEKEALNQKLEDRSLRMENLGSIAEASLELSNVFAAAQEAADLYVAEARKQQASTEAEKEKILAEARVEAQRITNNATLNAEILHRQAEEEAKTLVEKTEKGILEQWYEFHSNVSERIRTFSKGKPKSESENREEKAPEDELADLRSKLLGSGTGQR